MRKARFLFRFIDLGLVLLMAFLATADIRAEEQVQLPGGEASSAGRLAIFLVHFDAEMHAQLERWPEGTALCSAEGAAALSACMQRAGREARAAGRLARFVLSPGDDAPLQQLVLLRDLCRADGWPCAVARLANAP